MPISSLSPRRPRDRRWRCRHVPAGPWRRCRRRGWLRVLPREPSPMGWVEAQRAQGRLAPGAMAVGTALRLR